MEEYKILTLTKVNIDTYLDSLKEVYYKTFRLALTKQEIKDEFKHLGTWHIVLRGEVLTAFALTTGFETITLLNLGSVKKGDGGILLDSLNINRLFTADYDLIPYYENHGFKTCSGNTGYMVKV